MKIALAGNGWYPQHPGGLEKYAYGLSRTLTGGGDQVDFFCTGDPVPWDDKSRVFRLANPEHTTVRRLVEMRASYDKHYLEPYDVVDIHFAFYALPLLSKISRTTARVVHFQGPWALESRAEGDGALSCTIKAGIERLVYAHADRFITLSSAFKDILCKSYGVDAERIDVIPMGIDCNFFVPAVERERVRRELGWPNDRPVVFTARRFVNRVGITELIEATRILKAGGVRICVKIAGKGPLFEKFRTAIDAADLAQDIELLGFVSEDDLVRAYQAADVTVLPTQSLEGFGTIISESLACGTPVIGTPVGGIVDVLSELDPSLLARDATPAAIAELIASFFATRAFKPSEDDCRRHALEHFAWPNIAEGNRATYRRAIVERSGH